LAATKICLMLIGPRSANQFAVGSERPGVIEALQDLGVARVMAADQGPSMRAGVKEDPQNLVLAANKEQGPSRYLAAAVVSRIFHFRFVAQVDPAPVEYSFLLPLEQFLGCHGRAVHSENTALPIVDYQVLDFHESAPG